MPPPGPNARVAPEMRHTPPDDGVPRTQDSSRSGCPCSTAAASESGVCGQHQRRRMSRRRQKYPFTPHELGVRGANHQSRSHRNVSSASRTVTYEPQTPVPTTGRAVAEGLSTSSRSLAPFETSHARMRRYGSSSITQTPSPSAGTQAISALTSPLKFARRRDSSASAAMSSGVPGEPVSRSDSSRLSLYTSSLARAHGIAMGVSAVAGSSGKYGLPSPRTRPAATCSTKSGRCIAGVAGPRGTRPASPSSRYAGVSSRGPHLSSSSWASPQVIPSPWRS